MGVLLILASIAFIVGFVLWSINKFHSHHVVIVVVSLFFLGFFGLITCINMSPTPTKELILHTDATYKRLNAVIENRMEIDANLLKEIYDYNTEIETKRIQQRSLIYWGSFPAIYDEFELIDLEELEKSISEVDSSISVKIN